MNTSDQSDCKRPGALGVILAFITGAGIGASAILLTQRAQAAIAPTAEQLLSRCDRAADALDNRIPQSV